MWNCVDCLNQSEWQTEVILQEQLFCFLPVLSKEECGYNMCMKRLLFVSACEEVSVVVSSPAAQGRAAKTLLRWLRAKAALVLNYEYKLSRHAYLVRPKKMKWTMRHVSILISFRERVRDPLGDYCQRRAEELHSSQRVLGRAALQPPQEEQSSPGSNLWFNVFVLTRLLTCKNGTAEAWDEWGKNKGTAQRPRRLVRVTHLLPHSEIPHKKKKKTVATSFFANVWLLCLGGPANLFPFLGVQTWEGLENLIKMQR